MTYEYACTSCGHQWEAEQSIKDDPLKKCPKCKKNTARRQVSGGAGFVLKGGGWYADGYGSSGGSSSKGEDSSSSSDSKSSESGKKTSDKNDKKTSDKKSSKASSEKSSS